MQKYLHIAAKVIFSLILLTPILGVTGVFPASTRELYNTDQAFAFIQMLTDIMYINYMMVVVHVIALIALWTKREALAAVLELPITLNIIGFHLVIDGGLLTAGASMGVVLFLLNLYFLWRNRKTYIPLLLPHRA